MVAVVAACSLWLGPWAERVSKQMINEANRNLIVAGLEPGAFTEIPGGGGVIYVGSMSPDGSRFSRVFVYRQKEDRIDVTTSNDGEADRRRERRALPDPQQRFRSRRSARRRPQLSPAALQPQRSAHARARERSSTPNDPEMLPTLATARRQARRGQRAAALPHRAAAADAGVRADGGAAGAQSAAAGALRPVMLGFLGLHGRHVPDAAGHQVAGEGQDRRRRWACGGWCCRCWRIALWLYFADGRMRRAKLARGDSMRQAAQ